MVMHYAYLTEGFPSAGFEGAELSTQLSSLSRQVLTLLACFLSYVTPNSILSSKKMLVAGHVLLLPLQSVFRSMQNNHLLPEMQREKKHEVILSLLLLTSALVCTFALCKGA